MKRILIVSLALLFAFTGILYAQGINGQYDGYDVVKVQYGGVELRPDKVPGILYKGSTLVPLGLLRQAGFTVDWDSKTLTANIKPKKDEKPKGKVLSFDEISKLSDRVALIYALDENGVRKEQGSGFLINSKGLLITAHHVIIEDGQYRQLEVSVRGKTYKVPAGVTAFEDAEKDIAGVYLYDREPFPYFKVGDPPKVNDKVYGLGYPNGKLDVHGSKVFYTPDHGIFDTAEKVGGISGGPMLNESGQVVAVIIKGDEMGGMSVSIEHVMEAISRSINN